MSGFTSQRKDWGLSYKVISDKAQKSGKHELKELWFEEHGIKVVKLPLPVADYILIDGKVQDVIDRKMKRGTEIKKMDFLGSYSVAVDTKKDLAELYQDLIQDHARFHDEVHLAMNCGIKLYILVENKDGITKPDEIIKWKNPRMFVYYKQKKIAERTGSKIPKPPCSNVQLLKIMHSMTRDYGVEFMFCKPEESALRIMELLTKGEYRENG